MQIKTDKDEFDCVNPHIDMAINASIKISQKKFSFVTTMGDPKSKGQWEIKERRIKGSSLRLTLVYDLCQSFTTLAEPSGQISTPREIIEMNVRSISAGV